MIQEIEDKLNRLESRIQSLDFLKEARETRLWGGADVVIATHMNDELKNWVGNQPLVIGLQESQPRRRAVVTRYAKELSWLFVQLREIFRSELDYVTKYDFYGFAAQAAIDHLASEPQQRDCTPLLMAVVNQVRKVEFS